LLIKKIPHLCIGNYLVLKFIYGNRYKMLKPKMSGVAAFHKIAERFYL
jgi:hypothetical protein